MEKPSGFAAGAAENYLLWSDKMVKLSSRSGFLTFVSRAAEVIGLASWVRGLRPNAVLRLTSVARAVFSVAQLSFYDQAIIFSCPLSAHQFPARQENKMRRMAIYENASWCPSVLPARGVKQPRHPQSLKSPNWSQNGLKCNYNAR